MPERIAYLDGLRGVAIAMVLLFHAYVRWPELVPYGNAYSGRPWVAYGWLGVQLFFMISAEHPERILHVDLGQDGTMFDPYSMRLF